MYNLQSPIAMKRTVGSLGYITPSTTVAFDPLTTSPNLWLKGDLGTYQSAGTGTPSVDDGDPVRFWTDNSGNAHNASQASSTKRSTLNVPAQNGRSGLLFDGIDDEMSIASVLTPGGTPFTYFAVVKISSASKKGAILGQMANGGAAFGIGSGTLDSAGNELICLVNGLYWVASGQNVGTGTVILAVTATDQTILAPVFKFYKNNSLISTQTGSQGGYSSGNFYIGSGSGSRYWGDHILELLVWSSVLSAPDLASMFSYANTRWAAY